MCVCHRECVMDGALAGGCFWYVFNLEWLSQAASGAPGTGTRTWLKGRTVSEGLQEIWDQRAALSTEQPVCCSSIPQKRPSDSKLQRRVRLSLQTDLLQTFPSSPDPCRASCGSKTSHGQKGHFHFSSFFNHTPLHPHTPPLLSLLLPLTFFLFPKHVEIPSPEWHCDGPVWDPCLPCQGGYPH